MAKVETIRLVDDITGGDAEALEAEGYDKYLPAKV